MCPFCTGPTQPRIRIHQMAGMTAECGYTCDACGAICGTNNATAHHCQPAAGAAPAGQAATPQPATPVPLVAPLRAVVIFALLALLLLCWCMPSSGSIILRPGKVDILRPGNGQQWPAVLGKFLFSRTRRDKFTVPKMTQVPGADAQVNYYVQPHFNDTLQAVDMSQRSIDLLAVQADWCYSDNGDILEHVSASATLGKWFFSLTPRAAFTVPKTTQVLGSHVDYYVTAGFETMLSRYAMSQHCIELLAREAWLCHGSLPRAGDGADEEGPGSVTAGKWLFSLTRRGEFLVPCEVNVSAGLVRPVATTITYYVKTIGAIRLQRLFDSDFSGYSCHTMPRRHAFEQSISFAPNFAQRLALEALAAHLGRAFSGPMPAATGSEWFSLTARDSFTVPRTVEVHHGVEARVTYFVTHDFAASLIRYAMPQRSVDLFAVKAAAAEIRRHFIDF
jgi:hypothetical protein